MQQIWFQTFTGRVFSFNDISPDNISIIDVAHHLSLMCRYNGAVGEFYSVGSHSVLVSLILEHWKRGVDTQFAGLFHDAHEAYTGDIINPLKKLLSALSGEGEKSPIHVVEEKLDRAIRTRFAFSTSSEQKRWIKKADVMALAMESRDLLGPAPKPWDDLIDITPLPWEVRPESPREAEMRFLDRFHELDNKRREAM